MPPAYQVRVYSPAGNLQAVLDKFMSLNVEHRVNYASTITLQLYELDPAIQYFTLDALVEIRRRVPEANLDWYTEFIGFHRTAQRQITEGNQRLYTSYGRGLLDLINRRSIRYYADTDGAVKDAAPADDIIKLYVRENAGPLATVSNNRVTNGVTPGLSVAIDDSLASDYSGGNAWRNLLDTIRDIGAPHQVDFDVVWLGGANFEFRTYYPQLGTDRRAGTPNSMVFAPNLGNMKNPSYTLSRTEEISDVLVLGPGEGPLRDTTHVASTHTADSPWNLIELDQDASNEDREQALQDIGRGVLNDKRPAVSMPFEVLQTPQSTYGKHYFLGDLITGTFSTVTADLKIRAVTLTLNENSEENISLELEEITDEFAA